ncbi:hypothetical protein D3C79_861930 [compost metagenome]
MSQTAVWLRIGRRIKSRESCMKIARKDHRVRLMVLHKPNHAEGDEAYPSASIAVLAVGQQEMRTEIGMISKP